MRLPFLVLCGATCCAFFAAGQDSIRGPLLGLDYDPAERSIRPLLGIAGAAIFGSPLNPELALKRAWISPGASYALGEADAGESLLLLDPSSPEPVPLAAAAGAGLVTFSASGHSAALHFPEPPRIIILRGLPGLPKISEIDCASLPGRIQSLAVRDDGAAIYAGVLQDGSGSVYSIQSSGQIQYRFPLGEPSSIVLVNADRDAVVADRAERRIILARGIDDGLLLSDLPTQDAGIGAPGLLAASRDGLTLFTAGDNGIILALDIRTGNIQSVPCNCELLGLSRLNGNAVFRLLTAPGTPALLLDGNAPRPRILFVPTLTVASPSPSEGGTEEPLP